MAYNLLYLMKTINLQIQKQILSRINTKNITIKVDHIKMLKMSNRKVLNRQRRIRNTIYRGTNIKT